MGFHGWGAARWGGWAVDLERALRFCILRAPLDVSFFASIRSSYWIPPFEILFFSLSSSVAMCRAPAE